MGRERGRTRNVIFDKEKNTLRQQPFYGHSTAIRLPFYGNSTAILRQFYGGPRVVVISHFQGVFLDQFLMNWCYSFYPLICNFPLCYRAWCMVHGAWCMVLASESSAPTPFFSTGTQGPQGQGSMTMKLMKNMNVRKRESSKRETSDI